MQKTFVNFSGLNTEVCCWWTQLDWQSGPLELSACRQLSLMFLAMSIRFYMLQALSSRPRYFSQYELFLENGSSWLGGAIMSVTLVHWNMIQFDLNTSSDRLTGKGRGVICGSGTSQGSRWHQSWSLVHHEASSSLVCYQSKHDKHDERCYEFPYICWLMPPFCRIWIEEQH